MLPTFPSIPPSKTYSGEMTPEQRVTFKLVQGEKITKDDENILEEAIEFYKIAYPFLKSINLSELTDEEAQTLISFMRTVFNMEIKPQNLVRFREVHRVSFVNENFLEKGKVRKLSYLRQPSLQVVKERGVYGRANSPESTVFYAAIDRSIAILETKPEIGDRIIFGHWINSTNEGFVTYPIINSKTVETVPLIKAKKAFKERMSYNHPLFAEILDLLMEFISSEFVKDVKVISPKKYEYLYSAFFADQVLDNTFDPLPDPNEPLKHYDAIIYPSIAAKYLEENMAIVPESVKKLEPYHFIDCEVIGDAIGELESEQIPIQVKILRKSYSIDGDLIIWEDD